MDQETVRIFIGFDTKEAVAYHVLSQSILEKSTLPVKFSPIVLSNCRRHFHPRAQCSSINRILILEISDALLERLPRLEHLHGLRHACPGRYSRIVVAQRRALRSDVREA